MLTAPAPSLNADKLPRSQPKELHTRFLYSFFFNPHSVRPAQAALEASALPDRKGRPQKVWAAVCLDDDQPHHLYKEELHKHVVSFLFAAQEAAQAKQLVAKAADQIGCAYLRLTEHFKNRWFNKLHVKLPDKIDAPIELDPLAAVELFLSSYGVGVLSFALSPQLKQLDEQTVLAFNYRLSQLRTSTAAQLYVPKPPTEQSVGAQAEQPEATEQTARIGERFGRAGHSFTLRELIEQELLSPLLQLGYDPEHEAPSQLSIYTVVRFGDEVDFERTEVRTARAAFLSALTQLEEPTHAGAPVGTVSVNNAILNRRHWTAASILGVAHLIADQSPLDHPFNSARVPRLLLKYFIPYLTALLQRSALLRIIQQASVAVMANEDTPDFLARLRRELLRFAVNGHFTEVSGREVIHRYYRLCQMSLDVPSILADVRQALADLEAKHTTEAQFKLATETKYLQERMTDHLHVVRAIQTKVEWIEIVVIGLYFSELAHSVLSQVHGTYLHAGEPEPHEIVYSTLIMLAIGFIAGLIAYWRLKPWQHKERHQTEKS
ncbi:MAG: hypothetical protein DMF64_02715 [Acidobacteria bacterium]|nr:MAG: hypothetical protein DMF64_02715 [Acidobacteriota bacterium]